MSRELPRISLASDGNFMSSLKRILGKEMH